VNLDEELFDEISDERMAELLTRTVQRGTRIRHRRMVIRASIAALAVCVLALAVVLPLNYLGGGGASIQTAISKVSVGPFEDVVWKQVDYPGLNFSRVHFPGNIGCNPGNQYGFTVDVQQVSYIRSANGGTRIALVLVKCDSGTPTPSSLYAFTAEAGSTQPHLLQTLLAPPGPNRTVEWFASGFSVSKDAVILPARGVTGKAGLCCPNVTETMRWTLNGDHFSQHAESIHET